MGDALSRSARHQSSVRESDINRHFPVRPLVYSRNTTGPDATGKGNGAQQSFCCETENTMVVP